MMPLLWLINNAWGPEVIQIIPLRGYAFSELNTSSIQTTNSASDAYSHR